MALPIDQGIPQAVYSAIELYVLGKKELVSKKYAIEIGDVEFSHSTARPNAKFPEVLFQVGAYSTLLAKNLKNRALSYGPLPDSLHFAMSAIAQAADLVDRSQSPSTIPLAPFDFIFSGNLQDTLLPSYVPLHVGLVTVTPYVRPGVVGVGEEKYTGPTYLELEKRRFRAATDEVRLIQSCSWPLLEKYGLTTLADTLNQARFIDERIARKQHAQDTIRNTVVPIVFNYTPLGKKIADEAKAINYNVSDSSLR